MDTNNDSMRREDSPEQTTSNGQSAPGHPPKKKLHTVLEIVLYSAIILAGVYLLPTYVMQRTIVDGDSMNDTLQTEDNLLVNKLSYRFSNPERFDVIVFYPNGNAHPDTFFRFMKRLFTPKKDSDSEAALEDDYYIKRIIGLPGETVEIRDEKIYINGEILEEDYGSTPADYAGVAGEPIILGEDEYFVMGDNRGGSRDSRDIGPVKRENIDGKAVLRIYPFSEFGSFR